MKKITVSSPVFRSPRVTQVESMFDVPPSKKAGREWSVDLPIDDEDWNIGLIVGPSGSGKTTIAKHMFGDRLRELEWPKNKAVVDCFPAGMPIKEIVGTLTAVGFSTPPSWLQPYSTLSTGEQFRATLARSICETPEGDFAVIDEFTSTVDRQVAKVGSSAVQKAIRRNNGKLVALSCHNDIVDWLDPDWIYQTHLAKFTRRRLRRPRPPIELHIHKVDRSVWPLFRDHHYLSTELAASAQCFGVFVDDEIVAFGSYIHFPGGRGNGTGLPIKKGHRFVVLPDWQGLGIISALDEWIGEHLWEKGFEWRATFMHQGMIVSRLRSPRWRLLSAPSTRAQLANQTHRRSKGDSGLIRRNLNPRSLGLYTFIYVPKALEAARAQDSTPQPA